MTELSEGSVESEVTGAAAKYAPGRKRRSAPSGSDDQMELNF
jgi:hypothetical protein